MKRIDHPFWTRVRRHRDMRYALSGAALSLILLAILSAGCADSNNKVSGSTFDAVGLPHPGTTTGPGPGEAPNVDGVWRASTTVTFSSCGSRVPSEEGAQVVDLTQSDTTLNAHVFSACGTPIRTGVGTINGSSIFLDFAQNVHLSPN